MPTAGLFTSFRNSANSRGLRRKRCSELQFSQPIFTPARCAAGASAGDFDPRLCNPRVVDVPDVEMNADGGTVHVVQEFRELARAQEKALLGEFLNDVNSP